MKTKSPQKIKDAELDNLDGIELIRSVEGLLLLPKTAGIYYFLGGLYLVGVFGGSNIYSHSKIKSSEMYSLFGKSVTEKIMNYIVVHRNIKGMPTPYNRNGVYRPDGKMIAQYSTVGKVHVNTETALITITDPMPKVIDRKHDDLLALLKLVFEDDIELFMDFAAQFAFENRADYARPTIVLFGARGTGKNLIMEHFLKAIYPDLVASMPAKYDTQTGFKGMRAVILDEAETPMNREKVATLAKALSGSNTVEVKPRWGSSYTVKNQVYVIILSNSRPLIINETPINEYQNQWCCFNLMNTLSEKSEFVDLQKKYPDLTKLMYMQIGHFLKHFLLPYYEKKLKGKAIGRYGFKIPINKATQRLLKVNIDDMDVSKYLGIMKSVEEEDLSLIPEYAQDNIRMQMRYTKDTMLMPVSLLRTITNTRDYKDACMFFRAIGLFEREKPKKISMNGKWVSCYILNENIYQNLLMPPVAESSVDVDMSGFFEEVSNES